MRRPEQIPPPNEDKRWRMVRASIRQNGFRPDALIEVLHTVQEMFGYLDETAFHYVAQSLRVPLSRVYGVATFYHFFSLKPKGKHTCVVCTGTACFIKGGPDILEAIEEKFHIQPGETTEDGEVSLMTSRCVGACGLAPVVIFDGQLEGYMNPKKVLNQFQELMSHES